MGGVMRYLDIKQLRPYLATFIALLIIFNVFLAIVYRIPPTKIKEHVTQGFEIIEKEGVYLNFFPEVDKRPRISCAFQLDLSTDRSMLKRLVPADQHLSPWLAALEMNNYTRYWHGYTIFLRPLMAVFNYSQIRLINVFLLMALTVCSIVFLARYLNIYAALALLLSFICIKLFIVPLCMAFCNMFYVFYFFLFLMLLWAKWKGEVLLGSHAFSLFIFCLGIVTSFVDLLSTPLLPVGLLVSLACIWDHEKYDILPNPRQILRTFMLWCIGYITMWFSKWVLATILLGKNILLVGTRAVIFRIHGDTANTKIDTLTALKYNLLCAISPFDTHCILSIGGCIILLLILLIGSGKISINKKFFASYRLYFLLLLIGSIPFIWVLTIVNHSHIHFWFTYRIFCITIFSIFYILLKSVIFPRTISKLGYTHIGNEARTRT